MSRRIRLDRSAGVAKAFNGVVAQARMATDRAGLDRRLAELVNVRASQINGCASCLDAHTRAALAAGETPERLGLLPAWRDAGAFDEREQAALELAEVITDGGHVADGDYDRLLGVLGEAAFEALAWNAIAINTYNRISVLSGLRPARSGLRPGAGGSPPSEL